MNDETKKETTCTCCGLHEADLDCNVCGAALCIDCDYGDVRETLCFKCSG